MTAVLSRRAILPFVATLLLSVAVRADDWPQWRGPGRDGVWDEKAIVTTFPEKGLPIAWRSDVGGGWSSPVVAKGKVFLADSELTKPQARERVRCFDSATGKLHWTHAYDVDYPDWAFQPDQHSGPTSTPAVADGRVYTLGANGAAVCLAAATGEVIWQRDLAKDYAVESFRCRASPLIDGDRVILFVGGKPKACVVALDRRTGAEVWKALDEDVANSTPLLITAGGQRQLIVWTGQSVTSLDPMTGGLLWREPLTTSNNDSTATPVCDGSRLLISGLMFKLADDKPGASIVWPENRGPTKRILSNTSTPMLAGDAVFSANNRGDLVCLDAATGVELWKTDKVTDHKGGTSIHLTRNGDTVLLYNNLGELIRARLTRAGYEEISRTRLLEPGYVFAGRKLTWAPPAFAEHCVFARDERELVCALLAAGK